MRRLLLIFTLFSCLASANVNDATEKAMAHHVMCEFELTRHLQLLNVTRQLHELLVGHDFRIVNFTPMPGLLKFFDLDAFEYPTLITSDIEESEDGYVLRLFTQEYEVFKEIKFEFPPVFAWPILARTKANVDFNYGHFEDPLPGNKTVPDSVNFGVILSQAKDVRTYLSVENEDGVLRMYLGVDLPETKRTPDAPQRLIRTAEGWYRRTRIATLMLDSAEIRSKLGLATHP